MSPRTPKEKKHGTAGSGNRMLSSHHIYCYAASASFVLRRVCVSVPVPVPVPDPGPDDLHMPRPGGRIAGPSDFGMQAHRPWTGVCHRRPPCGGVETFCRRACPVGASPGSAQHPPPPSPARNDSGDIFPRLPVTARLQPPPCDSSVPSFALECRVSDQGITHSELLTVG